MNNKNSASLAELGFVIVTDLIPDAISDMRYCSSNNFVGERIRGYEEPIALLTKEAAEALKRAADELRKQGYIIKIFDAYRPQTAVDHFIEWAKDLGDVRMKERFYPDVDKSLLFRDGYISGPSGHSRGSTIDMTIIDARTGEELDMGCDFDFFGLLSHADYTETLTDEQINNRRILRTVMSAHNFRPDNEEWWHFSLRNEPYPNTYFDFPVALPQKTPENAPSQIYLDTLLKKDK